jgi:hypothetical protein
MADRREPRDMSASSDAGKLSAGGSSEDWVVSGCSIRERIPFLITGMLGWAEI